MAKKAGRTWRITAVLCKGKKKFKSVSRLVEADSEEAIEVVERSLRSELMDLAVDKFGHGNLGDVQINVKNDLK